VFIHKYLNTYIHSYVYTYMHTHIQVAAEELVRCLREERARTLGDNVGKKIAAQILESSLYSASHRKYTQATDFSEFLPGAARGGQRVRARAPRGGGGHERRCQRGMGAGVGSGQKLSSIHAPRGAVGQVAGPADVSTSATGLAPRPRGAIDFTAPLTLVVNVGSTPGRGRTRRENRTSYSPRRLLLLQCRSFRPSGSTRRHPGRA
jgi:hypothetical protein